MSAPDRRDDAACAAALAGLPGIGPVSLHRLLSEEGSPSAAWAAVREGRTVRPRRRGAGSPAGPSWQEVSVATDPIGAWEGPRAAGIGVTWIGAPDYPPALLDDPTPPAVLFWRGGLGVLDRPRVAIIGTRRATPAGRAIAYDLGRELAVSGVCVVSGLALGIDGAAHRGALHGTPPGATAGIAASGADVVYPRRHLELWDEVARHGLILAETPPGRPAQAWRFPARNRVIAGLAEVLVVVESHATGGSMLTVDAALDRGVEVAALPGPVRSPSSQGTNQLLREGAALVSDAGDVLELLGRPSRRIGSPGALPGPPPVRAEALPVEARHMLDHLGSRPCTLTAVVERAGLGVAAVTAALEALAAAGLAVEERGWWQRVG